MTRVADSHGVLVAELVRNQVSMRGTLFTVYHTTVSTVVFAVNVVKFKVTCVTTEDLFVRYPARYNEVFVMRPSSSTIPFVVNLSQLGDLWGIIHLAAEV